VVGGLLDDGEVGDGVGEGAPSTWRGSWVVVLGGDQLLAGEGVLVLTGSGLGLEVADIGSRLGLETSATKKR